MGGWFYFAYEISVCMLVLWCLVWIGQCCLALILGGFLRFLLFSLRYSLVCWFMLFWWFGVAWFTFCDAWLLANVGSGLVVLRV